MQAKLHQIDQSLRNEIVGIRPYPCSAHSDAFSSVVDFLISDVPARAHTHRRSLRVPLKAHFRACALEEPATGCKSADRTASRRYHLVAGAVAKGGGVSWFVRTACHDCTVTNQIFSVMDLGRLLLAFCEDYSQDTPLKHRFFTAMMTASSWLDPWETPLPRSRETSMLFFLRALANVLQDTVHGDEA